MARSHSRQKRSSGDSAITRSGAIVHWLGMLAMVVGLFAPLATIDAAATVMTPEQALMKAAQQPFDRDTTDFERVVLVGDFQQQVGCGDWDTNCDQTRLVNINGFWTNVINVPPGSWNWELIAIDRFGTQYLIDDGQVNVAEGQAGIYSEFNSATRDSSVSAVTGIAYASGMFGDVALAQDGDGFVANALNIGSEGWVDMQVTINGEPTQTGANFQQGVSRVNFDGTGNIVNVEHRGYAEVTVQRMDADGNMLPGGCYVLDGSSQSRGCDTDGSQDGTGDGNTILRFPGGFQPGDYTLRETSPADGAEPLADQSVNIQPGQSVIEARSEGEPTPETGDLVVLRLNQDGSPVAGACFELTSAGGEVIADACDDGAGRTEFLDVPAGEYSLSETRTPEGVEPAQDTFLTVNPGEQTEQIVQSSAIPDDEPPVDDPPVDEPPIDEPRVDDPPVDDPPADDPPVVEPTEETRFGRIIVFREDEFGNRLGAACFDAVNADGVVVYSACDQDGIAADDGITGLENLPVGTYTVVETNTPSGYEPADDQQLQVSEGDNNLVIQTAAISDVEEPPVDDPPVVPPAGDDPNATLVVNYTYEDGQPVACVEIESSGGIIGMSIPFACDNDENDFNPELGVIEMRSLEPGEFQVVAYDGPEYVVDSTPMPVTLTSNESTTITYDRPEPETTSFTVMTSVDGENPVGEACFILDESNELCDPGGRVTFTDVAPGEHDLRVTSTPQGHNLTEGDSQSVTVAADGSTTVSFQVAAATANLTVTTSDGTNNLAGACFILDEQGDPVCDDGTGVTFQNVTLGEHDVRMDSPPAGYNLPEESTQTVTVGAEGATATFTVNLTSTTFQIHTTDGTDTVGGACFTVGNSQEFCDDGSGTRPVTIRPGEWNVTMTVAPDGYSLPDPATQTVQVAADGSTIVTFVVTANTTSFTVMTSVDGENPVGEACFLLNEANELCDPSGRVTFTDVAPGEHDLRVTSAPQGYNLTEGDSQSVTVAADGTSAFSFPLTLAPVDITVTTINTETGEPLGGACYTLDDGEVVCDDESTGQVVFADESPGEKTLSMETAPEGFEPSADQTIPADVNNVEVGVLQETGSINVAVVDDATDEPLDGFCVRLNAEEPVCDTDSPGTIAFNEIGTGDHEVAITEAPADYQLPGDDDLLSQTVTVESNTTAQVTFRVSVPEPTTGGLDVTVQYSGDTPEPVDGACVIVTHVDTGSTTTECDDDGNGIVNFTDLPVGGYSITLDTDAYDGPPIEEITPVSGTVETDVANTATLNLHLAPTTGTLEITTLSGDLLIEGACYTVAGNEICDDDADDANTTPGVVTFTDLEPGTDIPVEMTLAPTGYQEPAAQTVEITAGVTTSLEFQLEAAIEPGSVTVRTMDSNDDPLTNACYRLVQGSTIIGPECDGDPADGDVLFEGVTPGTYSLQQTTRPSSNSAGAPDRDVEVTAGENTLVEVRMELLPGSLTIITVDSDDHSNVLPGACYRLIGDEEFGPFCDDHDGNLDGRVRFSNVPAGQYELEQTVSTAGYDPAANRNVTINPNGSTQITVFNSASPPPAESGTLVVIPLAPNGEAVEGGCYRVFDGGRSVSGRICDIDDDQPAQITFEGLPVGDLTLRETLAPSPDYELAGDITVTIQNGQTTTVEVPHQLKRGHVVIQAVNTVGLPLQGACFMLTDAGDMELCTDSTGQATVSGLVPGTRELTQTQAPFGYKLNETPREVNVLPGQTTTVRVIFENEPPPNTGTVQIQKFYCPAGDDGERTRFLGGAQGNQELQQTAGCNPGVATFTLEAEDGSTESNAEFQTNREGRAQLTAVEGIYLLTETDPDMPGNSAARIRVGVGQMTTVIVINYVAPPAPAPVTINVEGYTCPPGFNGSSFVDFQNSCMAESQLTNQITVRAEAANRYKRVTGDTGELGATAFTDLPAGTYSIWAQRPHSVPVTYLFCGADVNNPALKAVNGPVSVALESGSTILCRVFQVPPLFDAEHGAIQVHKFNCPINERQRGYDYQNECERPNEPIQFEIVQLAKTDGSQPQPVRLSTNADGIVQFPMLVPGTYKLTEVGGEWCFAQSNSVDAQGDVIVQKNKLSEVWVYNCVGTKAPPNTGSGDAANELNPDGGIAPEQVLPNLIWPTALLVGWMYWRDRKQA